MIPTITINGKTYTAEKPVARIWREFVEFDDSKKELAAADFIDAHAQMIAKPFKGVTADMILDSVPLDEILKLYSDIFAWLAGLLTAKLGEIKNGESGGA